MIRLILKFLKHHHKKILYLAPLIVGFLFYGVISLIYYERIASFLFFDEYANIIAGFFMSEGRQLYSQNFFNHQMMMAYLSYALQTVLTPDTLYQLISYHRIFIIFMSAVLGLLIVLRMRWIGLGILVPFELVKYYLFGNLFLAESLIVYAHIYLFYLAFEKIRGQRLRNYDYVISAFAAWFVVFSREPYVPLALFLFIVILFQTSFRIGKEKAVSLLLFIALSSVTFLTAPIDDYLYQVVYVNYVTVFQDQLSRSAESGLGTAAMILYPLYTLFIGEDTLMRKVLILVSSTLILTFVFVINRRLKLRGEQVRELGLRKEKSSVWSEINNLKKQEKTTNQIKLLIFIVAVLTLANVRVIPPGVEFYSAFYQIQWYVLAVTSIFLLIPIIRRYSLKAAIGLTAFFILGLLITTVFNRQYFLWENQNQNALFTYNYDKFYITGQAMKILAGDTGTMHVDLSDSLMYWTAGLSPAMNTAVYYPVMHDIEMYRQQRLAMFKTSPPDVYYANCDEGVKYFYSLSQDITNRYAPVMYSGNPSCLFVSKSIAQELSEDQLSELESLKFSIAPEFLSTSP